MTHGHEFDNVAMIIDRLKAAAAKWRERAQKAEAERDEARRERDALRALIARAVEAIELGERLVDYFANNRTSFDGSGTPMTFIQESRILAAEIRRATQTQESGK